MLNLAKVVLNGDRFDSFVMIFVVFFPGCFVLNLLGGGQGLGAMEHALAVSLVTDRGRCHPETG